MDDDQQNKLARGVVAVGDLVQLYFRSSDDVLPQDDDALLCSSQGLNLLLHLQDHSHVLHRVRHRRPPHRLKMQ